MADNEQIVDKKEEISAEPEKKQVEPTGPSAEEVRAMQKGGGPWKSGKEIRKNGSMPENSIFESRSSSSWK